MGRSEDFRKSTLRERGNRKQSPRGASEEVTCIDG